MPLRMWKTARLVCELLSIRWFLTGQCVRMALPEFELGLRRHISRGKLARASLNVLPLRRVPCGPMCCRHSWRVRLRAGRERGRGGLCKLRSKSVESGLDCFVVHVLNSEATMTKVRAMNPAEGGLFYVSHPIMLIIINATECYSMSS